MSMSERKAQPVDIQGQLHLVSSCQANADTGLTASRAADGRGLGAGRDGQAAAPRGGAFTATEAPPTPRAKGTPPPLRQELAAARNFDHGVRGGATANGGQGMAAIEQARKLRMIEALRCPGEVEGWTDHARERGFFPGEKAALDNRLRALTARGAR